MTDLSPPSGRSEASTRISTSVAKLNLFLRVIGRRPDGFHEIRTVFQLIDWGDSIRLTVLQGSRIVRPRANYDVAPQDDLAVRAASLLHQVSGCARGVSIEIDKRIPLGAGLGGGSSNAATVLRALNDLWACGLSVDELAELGAALGADVPVFVRGQSAFAGGRGELLTPIELGARSYLLFLPKQSVSTVRIFADPRLKRDSPDVLLQDIDAHMGVNDCEATVLRLYPRLRDFHEGLTRIIDSEGIEGVLERGPCLTGTGSAFFLPMSSFAAAERAAQQLKCRYNVRPVRGIDRSPPPKSPGRGDSQASESIAS